MATPFYATWALINVPTYHWFGNRSIVETVVGWTADLFTGLYTPVYPLTFLLACVSFAFATILLRRRFNLNWSRSVLGGSTFPFAFVSFFEALWQNTGMLVRPELFNTPPAGEALILSWALVGLSSLPFWRVRRYGLLVVGSIILAWIAWIALGYPQWFEGSGLGLTLNLVLKFQFFLLSLLLLAGR